MQIGELARRTGKSVAALRYYEQSGLLPTPERTEGGYRNYPLEMVERVRFIAQAQERGFALREIRVVLAEHDQGACPCEGVARTIGRKVARLDGQIAQLQARRAALENAVRLWESGLLEAAPYCAMLDASAPTDEQTEGNEKEMARTIEVFTAGCPLCEETLKAVQDAVSPCGCDVVARPVDGPEAKAHGITAVPTIVVDGQVLHVGRPTPEQAIALLRR